MQWLNSGEIRQATSTTIGAIAHICCLAIVTDVEDKRGDALSQVDQHKNLLTENGVRAELRRMFMTDKALKENYYNYLRDWKDKLASYDTPDLRSFDRSGRRDR